MALDSYHISLLFREFTFRQRRGFCSLFYFVNSSCQLSTHLADIYGQLPLGIENSSGLGPFAVATVINMNLLLVSAFFFSAANLNFSALLELLGPKRA